MPHKHYTQLSYEERVIIAHEVEKVKDKAAQINISQIARELGRDKSTVSRELRRNGKVPDNKTTRVNKPAADGRHFRGTPRAQQIVDAKHRYELRTKRFLKHSKYRYTANQAERTKNRRKRLAMQTCHPAKLVRSTQLLNYVEEKLGLRWSPEQISLRLKYEHSTESISHTAIYYYIHHHDKELVKHLRRRGRPKRKRYVALYNQTNRAEHSIHNRPAIVDELIRTVDLEGDTILGKNKSDRILTHNDRVSGLLALSLIKQCTAYKVTKQTAYDIKRVFNKARTITYDNGSEFTFWEDTTRQTNADIYFADPYTPSQRGRNENCNGLVRDFLPKGTDFNVLTDNDIMRIEFLLNNRPRKRLGGMTPQEAYVALNGLT